MHTHFSEILVSDHWLSTAWGNQFSPSCVWPAVTRAVSASLVVSWVLTHQSDLTPLPPSWPVSRRLSLHHETCRPSCGLGSLGSLAASGSDHSEPGWGWGVRGLRVSSERWRIGWDLTLDTSVYCNCRWQFRWPLHLPSVLFMCGLQAHQGKCHSIQMNI